MTFPCTGSLLCSLPIRKDNIQPSPHFFFFKKNRKKTTFISGSWQIFRHPSEFPYPRNPASQSVQLAGYLAVISSYGLSLCSSLQRASCLIPVEFFIFLVGGGANCCSGFPQCPPLLQVTGHIWLRNQLPALLASCFLARRCTFQWEADLEQRPRVVLLRAPRGGCVSGTRRLGHRQGEPPELRTQDEEDCREQEPWGPAGEEIQIPTPHFLSPP